MTAWFISATPEQLSAARSDPAFSELLTLGRVANFVRAVLAAGFDQGTDEGSAPERNRTAFFLLLTGVLAEALPVMERSGKHFRHLPGWQEHVRPILSDAGVTELRRQFLAPMRNQAVFHHDDVVSERGLDAFSPPIAQPLARGSSDSFMDVYFPVSDLVAISFIANEANAPEDAVTWLSNATSRCVQLGLRVLNAVDSTIAEALAERGFEWESGSPPAG